MELSDGDLAKSCVDIVDRWQGTLKSFLPQDKLVIHPEVTGYSSRSGDSPEFGGDMLLVQLFMECPRLIYMKEFMERCTDKALAHDAAKAIYQVAYLGLEIWTPEVIRDMYGYMNWYGCDTDADVLEEFKMNTWDGDEEEADASFKPSDFPGLLPSAWDASMSELGYQRLGRKPQISMRKLRDSIKHRPPMEAELAKAILEVRQVIDRGHVKTSDEERWASVEGCFIFLWDEESDQLRHAIDEVVEDRYNSGEGREAVLQVGVRADSEPQEVEDDVRAVEHLLAMRIAVGMLYEAMSKFVT